MQSIYLTLWLAVTFPAPNCDIRLSTRFYEDITLQKQQINSDLYRTTFAFNRFSLQNFFYIFPYKIIATFYTGEFLKLDETGENSNFAEL